MKRPPERLNDTCSQTNVWKKMPFLKSSIVAHAAGRRLYFWRIFRNVVATYLYLSRVTHLSIAMSVQIG
jgi:hypothetical protein